jgi:hypothetical protein
MNTLMLRTRSVIAGDSSSSSRRSSWNPRAPRAATPRLMRPVFVSSPAPKKAHTRTQRAA